MQIEREQQLAIWQTYQFYNHTYCKGRLIFGGELRRFWLTWVVYNVPMVLVFALTMPWLAGKVGAVSFGLLLSLLLLLYLLANAFMLRTSSMDPGILPKNKSLYTSDPDLMAIPVRSSFAKEIPVQEHLSLVNGHSLLALKLCRTCGVYRPPRVSHCGSCDNCVMLFDHHCPWLGTCIGQNNYLSFACYVLAKWSSLLLVTLLLIYQLHRETLDHQKQLVSHSRAFASALEQHPYAIVVVALALFSFCLITSLLCYHSFIILTNQTTNEQLKRKWALLSGNPFSISRIQNIRNRLLMKTKPSLLQMQSPAYYKLQVLNSLAQQPIPLLSLDSQPILQHLPLQELDQSKELKHVQTFDSYQDITSKDINEYHI